MIMILLHYTGNFYTLVVRQCVERVYLANDNLKRHIHEYCSDFPSSTWDSKIGTASKFTCAFKQDRKSVV